MLPLMGKSGINVGFIMKTLLRGGLWELKLGAKPNKKWGVEELPPSFISSK